MVYCIRVPTKIVILVLGKNIRDVFKLRQLYGVLARDDDDIVKRFGVTKKKKMEEIIYISLIFFVEMIKNECLVFNAVLPLS